MRSNRPVETDAQGRARLFLVRRSPPTLDGMNRSGTLPSWAARAQSQYGSLHRRDSATQSALSAELGKESSLMTSPMSW